MVDNRARYVLRNALSGFMQGTIKSREFDDTVSYYAWCDKTADGGVVAISQELFSLSLYDDSKNEPIDVPNEVREVLWRVWVFLRADLDYAYIQDQDELKAMREFVRNHWPFATPEQWKEHEHLRPASLPKYIRNVHAYRLKSTFQALIEVIGILCLAIGLLVLAYSLIGFLYMYWWHHHG